MLETSHIDAYQFALKISVFFTQLHKIVIDGFELF